MEGGFGKILDQRIKNRIAKQNHGACVSLILIFANKNSVEPNNKPKTSNKKVNFFEFIFIKT